ncbi:MAG: hypothetical protein GF331_23910 [Chitinivibrionales bacterium]|nr:hypothetical protein [Chitinivibrionales bacterium]
MTSISIIGMGAVCSAGHGVDTCWPFVVAGTDGLAPLSTLDTGLKEAPLCAQAPLDPNEALGEKLPNRTLGFSALAAAEAMQAAAGRNGLRLGVVAATTVAGMTRSERFFRTYLTDSSSATHAARELRYHEPTTVTNELARRYGATLTMTVSTACSTGLHAIGMAKRLIERGRCDLCLAVGADALSVLTIRGFASLTLLAPGGCKPFDKERAGISLGEGAGALLLASDSALQTLGTQPLACVRGWGASADCHHMTAPHPEGKGAAAAVTAALREASLEPSAIDLVAAHGTGTPDNDVAEVKALRAALGTLPPFCSMKRSLGHTLGASGALEAVFAARAITEGVVPRTGGFDTLDEAIGAAPSAGEKKRIRHVLKNAFGFGGNNAAMIFSEVSA